MRHPTQAEHSTLTNSWFDRLIGLTPPRYDTGFTMERPYQAPVGGVIDDNENEISDIGQNIDHDEESQEQIPFTPHECDSSLERFQHRSTSYLAFFRSSSKVSRTVASKVQRQLPNQDSSRLLAESQNSQSTARGPLGVHNKDDDGERKSESGSITGSGDGDNQVDHLRYSTTFSDSTTSSNAPALTLTIPILPGGPPQLANEQFQRQPRISLGAETRRATISPRTPDSTTSWMSNASHLLGESLLSGFTKNDPTPTNKSERRRGSGGVVASVDAPQERPSIDTAAAAIELITSESDRRFSRSHHNLGPFLPREWLQKVDSYFHKAHKHVKGWWKPKASLTMSPHSRNLPCLEYLRNQHVEKMKALFPQNETEDDEPVYDFCLVLTPQEVYSFWADILDFREEILGEEVVEAMENHWKDTTTISSKIGVYSQPTPHSNARNKQGHDSHSASTTPRRRRSPLVARSINASPQFKQQPRRPPLHRGESKISTTSGLAPAGQSTRFPFASPGIYSMADSSRVSERSHRSLFDRAVGTGPQSGFPTSLSDDTDNNGEDMGAMYSGNIRRKWGKSQARIISQQGLNNDTTNKPGLMSPATMIRSVTRGTALVRRPPVSRFAEPQASRSNNGPHEIRLEDIPNQVIPRGIAARTNGILLFLSALRRGFVVRRHRPGHEAMLCKLFSVDGGDTIQYEWVDHTTAMKAFSDQRQRYSKDSDFTHPIPWVQMPSHEPRTGRKGSFRTADIVVVHPARHPDPRSEEGDHGSITLRKSRSDYFEERTFTFVCRPRATGSLDEFEAKWYKNEGSESQYRYLDFETATEGEYWLGFRGMLLLHRDAAVGRFAEQRAAGIGSSYCRDDGGQDGDIQYKLHVDEFLEPVTVGFMEKMIVDWRGMDPKYMVGYKAPGAVPPPSDYFLGFKSPGTTIWSRLRYAGLNTHRVYAIDTNRVVIKISCPCYRLVDVAEVLRLKVKRCDGKSFAPFRQDMIDFFKPLNDPLEQAGSSSMLGEFQFSSADRQTIIDFIIRSRIRDSGAELGEVTVARPSGLDSLGRMIQARVPLHMPAKLDAIFQAWVFFWKREHWKDGRDGKSLTYQPRLAVERASLTTVSSSASPENHPRRFWQDKDNEIPSLFHRFFHGAFYQPLTSIEEYFGEKVAFYFAWLQHTAMHLVFLTIVGLVVFLVQVSSGNWDTFLRPYFSVCVMLWTFVVLVDWRKRAISWLMNGVQ